MALVNLDKICPFFKWVIIANRKPVVATKDTAPKRPGSWGSRKTQEFFLKITIFVTNENKLTFCKCKHTHPLQNFAFKKFYMYFGCMYVCAPLACMVPLEVRRGHWIPCNWSCRCYEPHVGVETKARSSTGAASALTQSPFSIPSTLSIVY